jgi:regulator of sigma E protease
MAILTILIIIVALSLLMALHEFGHFLVAKKLNIKVEEFGIGLPPRIWSKKINETEYSVNLIPFGAFVKIFSEEVEKDDPLYFRSYLSRPVWQRALVLLGGVVAFWVIAYFLFIFVLGLGVNTAVDDIDSPEFLNPKVQIIGINPHSPAQNAGFKTGDIILKIESLNETLKTDKEKEIRLFIKSHPQQPLKFTVKRGKKILDLNVTLSKDENGNGFLGVYLQRTATIKYPWRKTIIEAGKVTYSNTQLGIWGYIEIIKSLLKERKMLEGVELIGPVGLGSFMAGAFEISFVYFLQVLATISIFLAIFNLLPIPALDGGQLLFLAIEKIKRKPINKKTEEMINNFCFICLIILSLFVTIKDILNLL